MCELTHPGRASLPMYLQLESEALQSARLGSSWPWQGFFCCKNKWNDLCFSRQLSHWISLAREIWWPAFVFVMKFKRVLEYMVKPDATHSLSTRSSAKRLQCSLRLCSSRCFCCSESLGKKSFWPLIGILWLLDRAANSSQGLLIKGRCSASGLLSLTNGKENG